MGDKAAKSNRPAKYDLNAAGRRRDLAVRTGLTAIVIAFAVFVVWAVLPDSKKTSADGARAIRVTTSKLVTKDGGKDPKAVVSFYEDFLCPACGSFEQGFGNTVAKLIDIGAIAGDYYMTGLLDNSPGSQHYSSRAGNAAYCVADESVEDFRVFHAKLYSTDNQPKEGGTKFPDDAQLIEWARQSGAVGKVPTCVNSGKYISLVDGLVKAAGIHGTPTIKINGQEYQPSTPAALVAKIKEIVGDVPGIDSPVTSATS
jgi:protein-disulfide isomerase